jgi:hypothetical protein
MSQSLPDNSSETVRENYDNIDDFKNDISSGYNPISTVSIAISIGVIISLIGWINYSMFLGSHDSRIISHLTGTDFEKMRANVVNDATLNGFYTFIAVFIALFAYIFGFYYKVLLNGTQDKSAAIIVVICIASILGITSIFTSPIVSSQVVDIVKIFENTVGYIFISYFFYGKKLTTITDLLYTNEMYPKLDSFPLSKVNFNFLLTTFDIYNFMPIMTSVGFKGENVYNFHLCNSAEIRAKLVIPETFQNDITGSYNSNLKSGCSVMSIDDYKKDIEARRLSYDGALVDKLINAVFINNDTSADITLTNLLMKEMAKLVVLKNMVGQLCWTYIASLVTVLVSLKYLSMNK